LASLGQFKGGNLQIISNHQKNHPIDHVHRNRTSLNRNSCDIRSLQNNLGMAKARHKHKA